MILKSFELNKLKLENYNFYLFYGDNEGLKEDTIKNFFVKDYYLIKHYKYSFIQKSPILLTVLGLEPKDLLPIILCFFLYLIYF